MPRRALSKRWAVEPDYEPPLTRLKARDDPNVTLPRVQDVPLPARTRQRRVLVIPSAAAVAAAAAPLLQNAEEPVQKNLAEEMATGNEIEDNNNMSSAESQMEEESVEEEVHATEESVSSDHQRRATVDDMTAAAEKQTVTEGVQLDEMPAALDDLQIDDDDDDVSRGQEELPAGPTTQVIEMESATTRSEEKQIDERQMPPSHPTDDDDDDDDDNDDDDDDDDDDDAVVRQWTEADQRSIEREIREAAGKPVNERQYTWNLVVGIGSKAPTDLAMEDLGREELGVSDHEPETTLIEEKAANLATSDNLARPDSKETAAAANRDGSNTRAAQHDLGRPAAAAPVDWHEKSFSFLSHNTHHPLRLMQSQNENYHQSYRQNDNHDDDDDDDDDDNNDDDDDSTEQQQGHGHGNGHGQQQGHGQRQRQGQGQEQEQGQGQDQGQGQGQSSESAIITALQKNAMQLSTEPVLAKPDIIKDRNFVDNRRFARDNAGLQMDVNANHRFSIVSYNVMAELEKEDLKPAAGGGEEARAAGFSGGSRSGNRRDRRFGRGAGRSSSSSDLLPGNYSERLVVELYYLNADILCLQSIAEGYWNKLERYLNNWGYSCLKMNRRPGPSSSNCCEAIFFRRKQFELIKTERFFLDDLIIQRSMHPDATYYPGLVNSVEGREVVVMVTLCCRATGQRFIVANTRCTPEYQRRPDLQAAQVCCIVQTLANMSAKPDGRRLPTILCGNMDFGPNDGPYQVLCDGDLSSANEQVFRDIESFTIDDGQRCSLSSVDRVVFRHPMSALRSAYATVLGSDPPNVWKRNSGTFDCGSYVWFDESELSVVGVLDHVTSRVVTCSEGGGGLGGIPNEFFPSSNLSLKATFQFRSDGGLGTGGGR